MNVARLGFVVLIGALCCMASNDALAQTRVPAGADPRESLPVPVLQNTTPVAAPSIQVPAAAPSDAAKEDLLKRQVKIAHFIVEGVHALPFEEVAANFSALVDQQVSVADVVAAAERVTALYQKQGYVLSFCFVPAQPLDQDSLRVVVVEGYVGSVRLDGEAGSAEPKIRSIAESLEASRPLRNADFERTINVLSLIPGVKLTASAAPPKTVDGATELVLKVTHKPVTVGSGIDLNQPGGRLVISAAANTLMGWGEQLTLSALLPSGQRNEELEALGYSQMIGNDGTTVRADASHYRGTPDDAVASAQGLERTSRSDRVGVGANYFLKLSNTLNLSTSATVYASNNDDRYRSTANGGILENRTDVRALQLGLAYASVTAQRVRRAALQFTHGFDAFGASRLGRSDFPGVSFQNNDDLAFSRLMASFSQTDSWSPSGGAGWGTAFALQLQYSPDQLPTSERIGFGSGRFGQGYAAGEISGDSGIGASAELNYGIPLNFEHLKLLQPYLMLDAARASLNASSPRLERLSSVTVGARFADQQYYRVDVAVARPVGDAPFDNASRNPRVSASFSVQFDR